LPGVANVLRARCYVSDGDSISDEQVAVLEFMVDDQTPEDLAVGLGAVGELSGVLEVLQSAVGTKKGRIGHAIQVLTMVDTFDETVRACFEQTTTIGLRYRFEHRKVLARAEAAGVQGVSVKAVVRPSGAATVKADMGDLGQNASGHQGRQLLRREIETRATDGGFDEQ
ncbi:MAG: DUF111 family protein, partial [bacterium]|nr:DUF111 family protein [bacterium]